MLERRRRLILVAILILFTGIGALFNSLNSKPADFTDSTVKSSVNTQQAADSPLAVEALGKLAVKGRAPKTGYERKQFSNGWAELPGCDVRNYILKRDMTAVITQSETDCTVLQGTLQDPYTGKTVVFTRENSSGVQIDHVIALSNAWQTGAQQLSKDDRLRIANDPLNLLAVDGPTNQQKSDADAATWLPPNKEYRCQFIARQIAVKQKYTLWVTQPEHDAMKKILETCPGQVLPIVATN